MGAIPARCPIPANARIEGYPNPGKGDRHDLVLDNNNCWLYELYGSSVNSDGSWNADSAAVWDLQNDTQRPLTWTSADTAGSPIFPGLVGYDGAVRGTRAVVTPLRTTTYTLYATNRFGRTTAAVIVTVQ